MKKQLISRIALGSSVALATLSAGLQANENPFAANELTAGYQLAQADTKSKEGKCGEGKCGATESEGKNKEGKCGEGKCGAKDSEEKNKEGKCGEGKCGASS